MEGLILMVNIGKKEESMGGGWEGSEGAGGLTLF